MSSMRSNYSNTSVMADKVIESLFLSYWALGLKTNLILFWSSTETLKVTMGFVMLVFTIYFSSSFMENF
jgi:hypothetical protein